VKKWTRTAAQAALATYAVVGAGAGIASADTHTNGNFSLLGGNQISAPIGTPVNISGNAGALGGYATAASRGGAFVHNENEFSGAWDTSGKFSTGGGNQIHLPIGLPINVCGNAASGAGVAKAACRGSAMVINRSSTDMWHSHGTGSLLGANQIAAPVSVPANACGNSIAGLGRAKGACRGFAVALNGHRSTGQSVSMTGRLARVLFVAPARSTELKPPAPPAPGATGTGTAPMLPPVLQGVTGQTGPLTYTELPMLPGSGPVSVGSPLDSLTKPGATGASGAMGGSATGGVVGDMLAGTSK
jgi:ChpA-C